MKANLSRVLRSGIAMLLAICLVVGFVPTAAFATEEEAAKETINYVSFGDSMTNGYGLQGYNGNSGVYDYGYTSYANQFAAYLAGMTEEEFDAALADAEHGFGLKFEGPAANVNHYQLAMSGCRAEDLNFLLRFDFSQEAIDLTNVGAATEGHGYGWVEFVEKYEDEWYNIFDAGDMRTFTDICNCDDRATTAATFMLASEMDPEWAKKWATAAQIAEAKADVATLLANPNREDVFYATWGNHIPIVAEYYQNAVEKADVITLALGNTNFGTFMFNELVNSVMGEDKPIHFRVERAIENLSPEAQRVVLALRDELYAAANKYVDGLNLSYDVEDSTVEDNLVNTFVYGILSYYINYVGAVEAILEKNADVEIIQVALMNTFADTDAVETDKATLGDLLGVLYPIVNASLAALPTTMQAMGKWEEASFYYAEAPVVQCMVEVYGEDFYNADGTANRNSIIRKRFFRDLMGTIKSLGLKEVQGVKLNFSADFEGLCAYDEKDDAGKAAIASKDASTAMTYAIYLAFEKATIDAGKNSPVTLEAVMGLGSEIEMDGAFLGKVTAALTEQGPAYATAAATAIADLVNAGIDAFDVPNTNKNFKGTTTYADILKVYGAATSGEAAMNAAAKEAALAIAKNAANAEIIEELAKQGVYALITEEKYEQSYNVFAAANGLPYTWEQFKQFGGDNYTAFVEGVKATAWNNNKDVAINTAYDTAADMMVSHIQGAAAKVPSLCALLAIPNAIGGELIADTTFNSLLCLNARTQIGTGLGGHPAPKGHDELFAAVKDAYKNYTSKDETLKNLQFALEELLKIIETYGPDALEAAYKYAEENGYIDMLEQAIEDTKAWLEEHYNTVIIPTLEAQLEALEAQLKELKAQLKALNEELLKKKAELENAAEELVAKIEAAIAELEALIAEVEAKIAEIEVAIEELKAELAQLQKNIAALAEAVKDLEKAVIELKDALKAGSLDIAKKAAAAAREAAVAAYEAILDLNEQIVNGLKKVEGLYENVVELVNALNNYVTEKLNAIAALVGNVVDESIQAAIEAIKAELEKAIAAIENALAEEIAALTAQFEEKIAAAQAALAEKLAQIDAEIAAKVAELKAKAEEQIAAIKAEIEAKIAEIEACIAEKQAQLEELYAALKNASEEAKAEIEKMIAEVEAAIAELNAQLEAAKAELEAKIAEVKAQVEKQIATVKAQIEAAYAEAVAALEKAIEDLKAELEAKIAELKAKAEEQIEALKAQAKEQIETLLNAANDAVLNLIEEVKAQIEKQIATVINKTLEHVDAKLQELLASLDALIDEQIQNLLAQAKAALIRATTADLMVESEFKYVALGDGSAAADGYAEALNAMLEEKALENGVKKLTFVNAAKVGNTVAAEAANLTADVADADLITLGFSQTEMLGNALKALLAGETSFDWTALVGEEGLPYVEKAMEAVNAEIAALELDATNAAQLSAIFEAYAYSVVEYAVTLPQLIKAIRAVNTDAVVMVVGMYNPIEGVVIDAKHPLAGQLFYFELGQFSEYFDYLIHGSRAYGVAFALLTDEIDYVDAPEVAVKTPTMGLQEFLDLTTYGDVSALYPSAEGADYIAEQIAKALNLTFKPDGLWGDANGDGKVLANDAMLVLRYSVGAISADKLNLPVCDVDGNGQVLASDAMMILRHSVGALPVFPVEQ